MTLEDLITEVGKAKLLVNNLFQLSDGRWCASLRDQAYGYDFATAEKAEDALEEALTRATRAEATRLIESKSAAGVKAEDLDL